MGGGEAVALAAIAHHTRDGVAEWGVAAHLSGGLIVALVLLAPVAVGLLLLGGAFAWQRMRPAPQRSPASAR
ncbi:MAG: hypothetical protein ABI950_04600 [Solirubrobacteraceae bacterium]